MFTLEQQLAWEQKYRDRGRIKVEQTLRKAEEKGRVIDSPIGSGVLREYVLSLSQRIAQDITEDLGKPGRSKAYAPLLRDLDPDAVALLTISTAVNLLVQDNQKMTTLAYNIGKVIYGELVLSVFRDINEELYETMVNDLSRKMSKDLRHRMTIFKMTAAKEGIEIPEWSKTHKLQVGSYLLSLIDGEDGVIEQYTDYSYKKTVYMYQLRERVTDLMSNIEGRILNQAGFAVPCLIPPMDWQVDCSGGFHGALKVRAPRFFKGTSQQYELMLKHGCDFSVVLRSLNIHQRVPWRVNKYILNVIKGMRKYGYETKDVAFTSAYPKPERPSWLDSVDESRLTDEQQYIFQNWKYRTRDWHTKILEVTRIETKLMRCVHAADEFRELPEFYFVWQADDRSREYPVSGALSPQGSDMQKALLEAAHGLPITDAEAMFFFKLGIASKYGIDKESLADCVKWVDDNSELIIKAAEDPLCKEAFEWWSAADKPLQFLARAEEWRQYNIDPVNFLARQAVAFDGTCNGLQNYSALMRDPVGAEATNLCGKDGDKPNDIYGLVAKAGFKRLLESAPCTLQGNWAQVGFNRNLTKKSVMTQVYGSTFGTCRKSIVSYCYEHNLFDKAERYDHAEYASKIVWESIGDVVVLGKVCMGWLQKVASTILRNGWHYITWVAPSGWRCVQIYNKEEVKRVQTRVGRTITLTMKEETDEPNKIRHRNAFPPNFIHSCDASHLAFTSCAMEDEHGSGVFLHFIHDDFGALPAHAGSLFRCTRRTFVDMHEAYTFDKAFNVYNGIPQAPERGDFDIKLVLSSPNFFR